MHPVLHTTPKVSSHALLLNSGGAAEFDTDYYCTFWGIIQIKYLMTGGSWHLSVIWKVHAQDLQKQKEKKNLMTQYRQVVLMTPILNGFF